MMRNVLVKGLCASALTMAGLLSAQAADPVCEVVSVIGETHLGEGGRSLAVGDRLEPGAEIRTGKNGRMRLRFADESTLVVSDDSVLKIERYEQPASGARKASFLLQLGLIGQKVTPGGSWEVRTPTAVTAVRGTEFSVEFDQKKATSVNVRTGVVSVQGVRPAPGGGTRPVDPSEVVILDKPLQGTTCNPVDGCINVMTWKPERLRRTTDLLSGV